MIKIVKAGILDTFQDSGRFGFARWGVNSNGAMDQFALAAGNALVGNVTDTPALEMHFPAPEIIFQSAALISLTGADFSAVINGRDIPGWKSIHVPAGASLTFRKKVRGMRCYFSVSGGFDLPQWLGSASTNLKSGTGGYFGRALRTGDEVSFKRQVLSKSLATELTIFPWEVNRNALYEQGPVFITEGNECRWLTDSSVEALTSTHFSIDASSDRMASFLMHDPLQLHRKDQLLSSAVTFGTIQALPSGKLCVLMADHQTTGGYPRVAHVITAHLSKFSQISPGQPFTFSKTSIEEAEKMLLSLRSSTVVLGKNLKKKIAEHYDLD